MFKICNNISSDLSNIYANILHISGQSVLFSVDFIKLCAGTRHNLEGSIKPSSILTVEVSWNSASAKTTHRPRAGPRAGPYLPISLVTCTKLYQCTIRALIHGCEYHSCHGQYSARDNPKLEIYPINSVPGPLWAGWHGISVITLDPCRLSPWNLVRIQART